MKHWLLFGTLAATSLLGATSCKKSEGTSGNDKAVEGTKTKESGGSVTVNGSGSTFQGAFQEVAIDAFTKAHATIKVNYGAGGSGKGRQDFADKVTDYGCSDAPYKDDAAGKAKGGEFLYVPILLGAITVSYNVDGVDKLQLSADTIAKIFQRDIKNWNDPAIAADNPGVKLPDLAITVAHRSDGSGTTEQFTKFLDLAATGTWKLKSGSTVEWAADTQGGPGNNGVAQIVGATKGAIGYVDLPDAMASNMHFAAVKNLAGKFIAPSSQSAQAAGDGIDVKDNLTFVSVNAKGENAYPITAPSWCMIYTKQTDHDKGAALKSYFKYMVTDGQALIPSINFAPLPKPLADKAAAAVDKVQVPA
ncbi:MAG TPA: phosphate ABC transporter substrate-binding protein PstS [Kofleriaceae bacterium]|jgi:phosphate transport system substrate-binding protein|nr:phosphate ABC transporter substrate-binding protein PstS [Kofleriaceae bacterium]